MPWQSLMLRRLHKSQSNNMKRIIADPETLCIRALYKSTSLPRLSHYKPNLVVIIISSLVWLAPPIDCGQSMTREKAHQPMHYLRQAKYPVIKSRAEGSVQSHCSARKAFLTARAQEPVLHLDRAQEVLFWPVLSTTQLHMAGNHRKSYGAPPFVCSKYSVLCFYGSR